MIISIDAIEEVQSKLDAADNDTLVVFDCDEVLTTLSEQVWKDQNRELFHMWCGENIENCSSQSLYDIATSILVSSQNFLVNKDFPKIVENLQIRNIKTVVLTALSTKPIASIEDPMAWRIMTLKNFGYDFKKSWPLMADKIFDEFASEYPPMYSSGIICCGETPKGKSLDAFLNYIDRQFKKIIFLDDLRCNLEDVERSCLDRGLEFFGVQYLEAKNIVSSVPFSQQRIEYQLVTLKEKKVWICDIEAEQHIAIQKNLRTSLPVSANIS